MKIGVVVITFRRPALLRDALRSIANQTRLPDEVFISDNSPEPDQKVVLEFPGLPIRYHFHDRPLPIDKHWLWAIQQSQADLVSLLEDDNLYRPRHLEVLSNSLIKYPSAVLAGANSLVFKNLFSHASQQIYAPLWKINLMDEGPVFIPRTTALVTLLFGTPFASSAIMFRRAVLDHIQFRNAGLRISHDRWMWAQIAAMGDLVYNPEITMLYRDHPVQVVKNFPRAQHRADSAKCSSLIFAMMLNSGILPREQIAEVFKGYNLEERSLISYFIFAPRF